MRGIDKSFDGYNFITEQFKNRWVGKKQIDNKAITDIIINDVIREQTGIIMKFILHIKIGKITIPYTLDSCYLINCDNYIGKFGMGRIENKLSIKPIIRQRFIVGQSHSVHCSDNKNEKYMIIHGCKTRDEAIEKYKKIIKDPTHDILCFEVGDSIHSNTKIIKDINRNRMTDSDMLRYIQRII